VAREDPAEVALGDSEDLGLADLLFGEAAGFAEPFELAGPELDFAWWGCDLRHGKNVASSFPGIKIHLSLRDGRSHDRILGVACEDANPQLESTSSRAGSAGHLAWEHVESLHVSTHNAPDRFAAWLRRELLSRGFDVGSQRGGARDRFAKAAGVSPALVSRTLSGERIPDFASLKKIGQALGIRLADVLIAAELADVDDLIVSEPRPAPVVALPDFIDLSSLPPWERAIWLMEDRSLAERSKAIGVLRIVWGDVDAEALEEDPEPNGGQVRRMGGF